MPFDTLSVVIPLFNDADIVEKCYAAVRGVLDRARGARFADYEIVFVDDGSGDATVERLLQACGGGRQTMIVELDRNYGQHAAICAGFETARGDVIVTLDSDLQIDPGGIPLLLEKMEEGYDLVSGVRLRRKDSFLMRTLPSRLFNRLVGSITGVRLRDWGCPAVALRKDIAKRILRYGEMRRFLKPLGVKLARRVGEVELAHQARVGGESGYGVQDLFELALDFITNFSLRPFQKVSLAGIVLFSLGILGGLVYLVLRFGFGAQPGDRSQALIFLAVVVGLQIMILGFLGEFVIRIYRRENNLPLYTIRSVRTAGGESR